MTAILNFLIALAAKLAVPVMAFFAGKGHAEKKKAEQDAQDFKEEAKRWADAPVTDSDFDRVLKSRIKAKLKARD